MPPGICGSSSRGAATAGEEDVRGEQAPSGWAGAAGGARHAGLDASGGLGDSAAALMVTRAAEIDLQSVRCPSALCLGTRGELEEEADARERSEEGGMPERVSEQVKD